MSEENETVNTGTTPAAAPAADPSSTDGNPAPSNESAADTAKPAEQSVLATDSDQGGEPTELKGLGEGDDADEAPKAQDESGTLGAPEGGYDFSGAKLPEGFSISEAAMGKFTEVAQQLNLSQAAATKLVEEVGPAIEQAQRAQIEELGQKWLKDAYADADMGGAKWKTTLSDANRALNQFCPPKLRQVLAATGLNRNPDVIRMFRDIGRAVGSDPIVTGKAPVQKQNPLANFYDKSDMNF